MSDSAAAAESPATPAGVDAAIQMLRDANAAEPVAPTETAPTPEAPPPSTPTEAAPPAATPDEVTELLGKLEARRTERAQKQQPDVVSQLQAKIDALEARLAQPQAPAHHDFAALVREHGEVRAMEIVGLDPMAYFARFKEKAKDPGALARERAEAERQKVLDDIAAKQTATQKQIDDWNAQQQRRAEQDAWSGFINVARAADPILAKIPHADLVEKTQKKMAEIDAQYGAEARAMLTDDQLAKLVAKDYRSLRDLLAGIDAGATPPTPVPANDGARQPATATLSNDLASQGTGQTRVLSEDERVKLAIAELRRAQD